MSVREYLLELKISLLQNVDALNQALALIPEEGESVSSGESAYASEIEDRQIPSPPSLVRQNGEYPPIELSDEEELKLEEPIPSKLFARNGSKNYKKLDYD